MPFCEVDWCSASIAGAGGWRQLHCPAQRLWVSEMPQPLVGGHQGLHIVPSFVPSNRSFLHQLQDTQKSLCDVVVALFGSLAVSNQDLVRQLARVFELSDVWGGALFLARFRSGPNGCRIHPI